MYDEKRRNGELAAAREDGEAKGRAEGRAEGHAEGMSEGIAKGRTEGRAEGLAEAQAEIARKMKSLGIDIDTIVQATGLDREAVESL